MISEFKFDLFRFKFLKGFLAFLILFLPLPVLIFSVGIGYLSIPPSEVLHLINANLFQIPLTEQQKVYETVIFNIRLPRILLAALVGCSLAVSGAVLQSMFRNPLVEPYILGISSGAAFGAALALGLGFLSGSVQILAFVFGMISVFLAYSMAKTGSEVPVVNLVLAGIIVSALFTALTSLIKFFIDPHQLAGIVYWIMGSFSYANWNNLATVTAPILACLILLIALSWRLNVLSLSDEEARALGVNVNRERFFILCIATLMTACAVSVSGIIGWVGLLIPHIVRLAFSSDNRIVIPLSASLGASFMVLADNIARSAFSFELPISVLTTILGAPVFMLLVRRRARRIWG
ncbi:MAG: iron ABC transporter permease [Archaeoglobaceae archaeon]|nr:iron ABC transporter permease [Archaeoglobaceae archaeon]MDW8128796.1 iron ABC transporter permease [Archaeoglobaceae archaeon]